jgi:hypothetical protein
MSSGPFESSSPASEEEGAAKLSRDLAGVADFDLAGDAFGEAVSELARLLRATADFF